MYEDLRDGLYREYELKDRKSLRSRPDGSRYLCTVYPHLDRFFEGYEANDIGSEAWMTFVQLRKKARVSTATINRSRAALTFMFQLAIRDGRIEKAPYLSRLREPNPRRGFLEYADYKRLHASLAEHLQPLLTAGYFTGQRLGELRNLRWSNVDLMNAEIRLDAGTTKNDAPRTIPLLPELLECLRMEKVRRDAQYPACGWVFHRRGRQLVTFRRSWMRACVGAGLGTITPREGRWPLYEGLEFHDLRRSAVRNLRRSGVSENTAMKITGHKTADVFRRYDIVSSDDLKDTTRKLHTHFTRLEEQGPVPTEEPEDQDRPEAVQ